MINDWEFSYNSVRVYNRLLSIRNTNPETRMVRLKWLSKSEISYVKSSPYVNSEIMPEYWFDPANDFFIVMLNSYKNCIQKNSKLHDLRLNGLSSQIRIKHVFLLRLRSLCDAPLGFSQELDNVIAIAKQTRDNLVNKPTYSFPDIQVLSDACTDCGLVNDVKLFGFVNNLLQPLGATDIATLGWSK